MAIPAGVAKTRNLLKECLSTRNYQLMDEESAAEIGFRRK
jgi:hypothetical protein